MNDTFPEQQPQPIAPQNAAPPTVCIMGAGGCGINMVRRLSKEAQGVTFRRFDTSYSNLVAGEDLVQVADGAGSGKNRATHAEAIMKRLSSMTPTELGLEDINVVLFSLSGGSGSVIGPVLIREIARRKKKVVAAFVADTSSERDASNTLRTLQTLQAITTDDGVYLPTMAFSNAAASKSVVDITLPHRVTLFTWLMTLEAQEIDRNDRLNFLDGIKMVNATPGIRLMHMTTGDAGDSIHQTGEIWNLGDDDILDATMSIGTPPPAQEGPAGGQDHGSFELRLPKMIQLPSAPRVSYEGVFKRHIGSPIAGMIAAGNDAIEAIIADISSTMARFNSQSQNVRSTIDMTGTEKGPGGLII